MDYKVKKINIDGTVIKLQLWDTAGQERFQSITYSYFKDAHGVLIIFDLSDKQSFLNVERWIKLMQDNQATSVLKVLIGNKSDLQKEVEKEEIQTLCCEFKLPYFEVSAKIGQNITEPFEFMAKLVKKQYLDVLADSILMMRDSTKTGTRPSTPIQLKDAPKKEIGNGGCCSN